MKILGISAFFHDSAAAIIEDGEVIAAAQEERFSRIKHDAAFPKQSIIFCLAETGFQLKELDAITFYEKPLLKFERLLETYFDFAPKGFWSFFKAIPVWIKEKLFVKQHIRSKLKEIEYFDQKAVPLLFSEHHLSHAASAFYQSSFEHAAILTVDGLGEWATAGIYKGSGRNIQKIKELNFPDSLGLLYSSFTYFLGFKVNSGEYKLMGLAPYGNSLDQQTQNYKQVIKEHLCDIFEDGSIQLNQAYFSYATSLKMIPEKKWERIFNIKRRLKNDPILQEHCNMALAIQEITEECIIKLAVEAKKVSNSQNLTLAGGVALNCKANGLLAEKAFFEQIFVQPAANDAGGAIGAALASYYLHFKENRLQESTYMPKNQVFLGPEFSNKEIKRTIKYYKLKSEYFDEFGSLCKKVAGLLNESYVIGWFQGRMEFGPRALGNRSILADPRKQNMQDKVNKKIKKRESFRPFAPSVIDQDANFLFDLSSTGDLRHMLFTNTLKTNFRNKLPENFENFEPNEKRKFVNSNFPAVTHVDFSARIQVVTEEHNKKYYELLKEFKSLSGYGILLNTSFNLSTEPIVCTPEDACKCFLNSGLDLLIMNNFITYGIDEQ
jgi:carbamoyltransferase